jgi:hypothetical protein
LERNTEHFVEWQGTRCSRRGTVGGIPQVLLQRLTPDEVHHQVPVLGIGESIVDLRQIDVFEGGEQQHLAVKAIGRLDDFLGVSPRKLTCLIAIRAVPCPAAKVSLAL